MGVHFPRALRTGTRLVSPARGQQNDCGSDCDFQTRELHGRSREDLQQPLVRFPGGRGGGDRDLVGGRCPGCHWLIPFKQTLRKKGPPPEEEEEGLGSCFPNKTPGKLGVCSPIAWKCS